MHERIISNTRVRGVALGLTLTAATFLSPPERLGAQEESPGTEDPSVFSGGKLFASVPRGAFAIRVAFGSYSYNPVAALPGMEGSQMGMGGFSIFPERSRSLGIDLEFIGVSRSIPNDFWSVFGSVDDRTELKTQLISLGARLRLPPGSPVRAYVSAGLGFIQHDMEVGGSVIGIPGSFGKRRSRDWAPILGFGVDARLGSFGASVDFRQFQTTGTFGDPFQINEADLGGSSWFVGAAWYPGSAS